MQMTTRLEVRRDDLAATQLRTGEAPPLDDGDVLVRVERFALTANNVTYGVVGERIGYWDFFPAADGWGVIPAWGFGCVTASAHPDIGLGERLYGYFPMGTHLRLESAEVSERRVTDGAAHRAGLPAVYNQYVRIAAEPDYDPSLDDERMLLFPLYATSFCLHDFLSDNGWFGAARAVLVSASSKTAIGLALAMREDDAAPPATALTSASNLGFVERLGLYAAVHAYPGVDDIDASLPTVIVDFSGNGALLAALHRRLGDRMRFCSNVGITHYDEAGMQPGFIAERSAMFFAPAQIHKRNADWGAGVFSSRVLEFWRRGAVHSREWLTMDRSHGVSGLQAAYRQLLQGRVRPERGVIVELAGDG